nr:hypothetical protein [Tanacetum cinerariifolium]
MPTKIELTLEQSQQGVSNDVLEHEPEDDDEDPNEEHEPEDEDTKEEEPYEGFNETKPFEEDETAITPPPLRNRKARISVRPQTPMAASTQALIDAFAVGSPLFPLPPTSPTYDQAQLEDVGYVRALQAYEHRMMTSIKEVNLRVSYQAQVYSKRLEECLRDKATG